MGHRSEHRTRGSPGPAAVPEVATGSEGGRPSPAATASSQSLWGGRTTGARACSSTAMAPLPPCPRPAVAAGAPSRPATASGRAATPESDGGKRRAARCAASSSRSVPAAGGPRPRGRASSAGGCSPLRGASAWSPRSFSHSRGEEHLAPSACSSASASAASRADQVRRCHHAATRPASTPPRTAARGAALPLGPRVPASAARSRSSSCCLPPAAGPHGPPASRIARGLPRGRRGQLQHARQQQPAREAQRRPPPSPPAATPPPRAPPLLPRRRAPTTRAAPPPPEAARPLRALRPRTAAGSFGALLSRSSSPRTPRSTSSPACCWRTCADRTSCSPVQLALDASHRALQAAPAPRRARARVHRSLAALRLRRAQPRRPAPPAAARPLAPSSSASRPGPSTGSPSSRNSRSTWPALLHHRRAPGRQRPQQPSALRVRHQRQVQRLLPAPRTGRIGADSRSSPASRRWPAAAPGRAPSRGSHLGAGAARPPAGPRRPRGEVLQLGQRRQLRPLPPPDAETSASAASSRDRRSSSRARVRGAAPPPAPAAPRPSRRTVRSFSAKYFAGLSPLRAQPRLARPPGAFSVSFSAGCLPVRLVEAFRALAQPLHRPRAACARLGILAANSATDARCEVSPRSRTAPPAGRRTPGRTAPA